MRHFSAKPFGHGGEKRSYQILQLLKKSYSDVESITIGSQPFAAVEFCKFISKLIVWRGLNSIVLSLISNWNEIRMGFNLWQCIGKELRTNEELIFFWEATLPCYSFFPRMVKGKVHALPHNLESLVPVENTKQSNYLTVPYKLLEELKVFQECTTVGAISQEENWLLELNGIKSYYLPYFPVGDILDQCKTVYAARGKNVQINRSKVLVIGTVGNPPTYQGMYKLLQTLSSITQPNIEFHIVGYGTEVFKDIFNPNFFYIYGGINQDLLNSFLSSCSFVLINQPPSSGALTKLPEFSAMGINVFCNKAAIRSMYHLTNIKVYNNMQALIEILQTNIILSDAKDSDFTMEIEAWGTYLTSISK